MFVLLLPLLAIAGAGSVVATAPVPDAFSPRAEAPRGSEAADTGALEVPRALARAPFQSQPGARRHLGDGPSPVPHSLAHALAAGAPPYFSGAARLTGDVAQPGVAHEGALARSGAISAFATTLPPPAFLA